MDASINSMRFRSPNFARVDVGVLLLLPNALIPSIIEYKDNLRSIVLVTASLRQLRLRDFGSV